MNSKETISPLSPNSEGFDQKKRVFFTRLGLRAREWFKTHRDLGGLWEGAKNDRWDNVSEHCLVEAARAQVLGELLGLSEEARNDLFAAAVIHDFNKKQELSYTKSQDRNLESFDQASQMAKEKLAKAYIRQNIIEIADSVAHTSLDRMNIILSKEDLSEADVSSLVLHYIDDYTLNSNWVTPKDGDKNDLDRRMDASDANKNYAKVAAAGFYIKQREIGHLIENKIADLLMRKGNFVDPKDLPEYIDNEIKRKILNS